MIPSKSMHGQTIKSWNSSNKHIQAINQDNQIFFTLTEDGKTESVPTYQVSGIPNEVKNNLSKYELFLENTYVTANKLSDGSHQLYINPRLLGGANTIDPIQERGKLWKDGIIPFEIDTQTYPLNADGRAMVLEAVKIWNDANTGFQLVPRINEQDYVCFGEDPDTCYSRVGRAGGKQYIHCDLDGGGFKAGNLAHEIGHVIGFYHEHTRSDRDIYVTVGASFQNNVNYKKIGRKHGQYDFNSIMHYPLTTPELSPRLNYIIYKDIAGQRTHLSAGDIAAAEDLFKYTQNNSIPQNLPLSQMALQADSVKPQWQKMLEEGRKCFNNRDYTEATMYFLSLLDEYDGYLDLSSKKAAEKSLQTCVVILTREIRDKIEKLDSFLNTKDYTQAKRLFEGIRSNPIYQRVLSLDPETEEYVSEKLLECEELIQQRERAENTIQKAENYLRSKNYDLARTFFTFILEKHQNVFSSEEIKDFEERNIKCTEQIALKIIQLGDKFHNKHDLEKALKYYSQALTDYKNVLSAYTKYELDGKIYSIVSQLLDEN